jgi:hypothetical protein
VTTHVELYKALVPHVGQEAAQMIADAVPPASNIATKDDVYAVKEDVHAVSEKVQTLRADFFRWGLAAVLPVWIAVWGTLVAQLLQGR